MSNIIKMPMVSPNDETAILVQWHKSNNDLIRRGESVCSIETTKAMVDVEAEADGYLVRLVEQDQQVAIGAPIAVLTDTPGEDITHLLVQKPIADLEKRQWTKKAELLAKRIGVDLHRLAENHPGKVINEADVQASLKSQDDVHDLLDDKYPHTKAQRILLLGGGAGSGIITLDVLSRLLNQRAVGILDNNPALQGKTVMGVPILGPNSLAEELWDKGMCDAMINVITANIDERAALFERLAGKGVRFANVIDPSVSVRAGVSLGQGNLIMGSSYLAACVSVGDNNFFASHVCIEHHSRIGSHCTFGPRSTTAGGVTIGNRVKLGMMVAIENYLTIGDNCLIPSGVTVTDNVPENSVLKVQQSYVIRPLTKK